MGTRIEKNVSRVGAERVGASACVCVHCVCSIHVSESASVTFGLQKFTFTLSYHFAIVSRKLDELKLDGVMGLSCRYYICEGVCCQVASSVCICVLVRCCTIDKV